MNLRRVGVLPAAGTGRPSRRDLLRGLTSAGLALGIVGRPEPGAAKKKRKKKIKRNRFGCVNVGSFCKHAGQCCSGICKGREPGDKTLCRAHDTSTCAGQDGCVGEVVACTTTEETPGTCAVTTGNASYCSTGATCVDCAKDAECVSRCGEGAACIICAECAMLGIATACASRSAAVCTPL
jgi:hypothetical protein